VNQSPATPRWPWIHRAERFGRNLENLAVVLVLGGLVGLAGAQILLRNVFSAGLPWSDGLVRLGVLWLAVLGAVAASRDDRHLAIDLLARYASPQWRRWAAALSSAAAAFVTGLLTRYSWRFVQDSRSFGDVLLDQWPAWYFQAILPVGFALICYRYSLRSLKHLLGR
jgi:TRAP-type C4-dicarboxylate transport system permease small subunit